MAAAEAPAANARGEHRLPLGGKVYILRPSFAAIEAAETGTGQSLIRLMQLAHAGGMTLAQIAWRTSALRSWPSKKACRASWRALPSPSPMPPREGEPPRGSRRR